VGETWSDEGVSDEVVEAEEVSDESDATETTGEDDDA